MTYHYPDHVRESIHQSLDQDKKTLILRMIRIRAERKQKIEDVLWDIALHTSLETATGFDLDRIGAIVGEARQGRSDERYRLWVRARALLNRSAGRVDDLLKILRLILPAEATIEYQDIPDRDAEAYFTSSGVSIDSPEQVQAILREAVGAGIQLFFTASETPEGDLFAFAGGTGKGFGDGVFAGIP